VTTALAYTATSQLRQLGEGEGAVEDLAVVWAIVQFVESMPASIEDQQALKQARVRVYELAAALGTNEAAMKEALLARYTRLKGGGGASVLPTLRLSDTPA
jgi:hypothetical protein